MVRKFIKHFTVLFAALIFTASLTSCFNDLCDSPDYSYAMLFGQVEITGPISVKGALPEKLSHPSSMMTTGRAALPSLSGAQYFVHELLTDTYEPLTVSDGVYSLQLTLGKNHKFQLGIWDDESTKNHLFESEIWETGTVTSRDSAAAMTHSFVLEPVAGGSGTVKLPLYVTASGVTKIESVCSKSEWGNTEDIISSGPGSSPFTLVKNSIPANIYEVTFIFYKGTIPCFSTTQAINVIGGFETDKWKSSGGSLDPIDSSGKFEVTGDLVAKFERTQIHVKNGASGSGSYTNPCGSIAAAVSIIKSASTSDSEYTIWIHNTVEGTNTLAASDLNSKAAKITICGVNGLSEGVPQDVLNGNESGSVLTITTTVPIVIKNLKITGGKEDSGGGINMGAGTKVTLESGAMIGDETETVATALQCGNFARDGGGGIFNNGGTLTLNSGSKVCHNYAQGTYSGAGIFVDDSGTVTINDGAEISYNSANNRGGGILLAGSATVIMNGGSIYNNDSYYFGGGVMFSGDSGTQNFYMNGGIITSNKITSEDSDWSPGGAGVYIDKNGIFTMKSGAEISGNTSTYNGGGVRVKGGDDQHPGVGIFDMQGGTISGNKCTKGLGGAVEYTGTSLFKISGNACIPLGTDKKNDVFVATDRRIEISDYLTDSKPVLAITPQEYTRGIAVVQGDGTYIQALKTADYDYTDYFIFADDNWKTKLSEDNRKLLIDAPIYVKQGGSGTTGTKNDPFGSIANACSIMNNLYVDYTIYVDGEVKTTGGQTLPDTVTPSKAHSITITGASGDPSKDILNANNSDSSLTINTEVPVTITNLTITGGAASLGGGIRLSAGSLTLGDDVLIQNNKASGYGGIYVESTANLYVYGNVVVWGNTVGDEPSNVFLPDGKIINVIGPLTKGSGANAKNAKIGISTQTEPTLTEPVQITSGYGYGTGGNNAGVNPGTYFFGDKWGIKLGSGTSAGEALIAASGGQLIIEPIYEDITVKVDKSSVLKSAAEKKFTFSAIGTDSEGNSSPITIGSGEGQLALSIDSVTYHGETVPASYYDTGTDYVTLGNSMPAGNYTINTRAVYQGSLSEARTYSASFEVKIVDGTVISSANIATMTFENEVEYYFKMDSSVTAADIRSFASKIDTAITNGITIGNSTIDLSNTTVTSIDAFSVSSKITKLILPAGVQNLAGQTFQDSPDLEEIVLPGGSNNKYLVEDGILYDKDKTTLVYYPAAKVGDTYTLPETVTKLQMEAFQSNKNLVTINGLNRIQNLLHDGIFNSTQKLEVVDFSGLTCTNLRGWTFVGSHIKKIIVSSSINTFGSSCFNSGLEEIHFLGTTPPATTESFVPASTRIYVPTGYKTVYEEWVAEHSQSNTVYEE